MKATEKFLKYLFSALLMGLAANTLAASLGRMRGAAMVGHPLDVTLSAQLDSAENPSSACVSADVFFGDSQVSPDRVRTAISPGAGAGEILVRIRTTSALDEPVVTIFAREGCQQKNSRKYVLLAEMLGDNTAPVSSALAQAAAAASSVQLRPAAPSRVGTSRAKPETRAGMASSLATPPVRAAGKPPAPVRQSRARLQLAPIDLTIERDPVLRSSPELLTPPSIDAQQRTTAAALWQALNAQPQDMLRDGQRLKSLESDVAAMLAQSRKTEQAVTELRGQLEQARQERYSNWLVYALGAVLLFVLLAAGLLWRRNRQHALRFSHGPWWDKNGEQSGFAADAGPASGHAGTVPAHEERVPKPAVDLDLDALHFESTRKLPAARPVEADRPEFLPSLGGLSGMPRLVNAEELFDVQQQADFFLSLGHPDKAVDVLRLHIMDNVETSALVYLDLFDLYHSLGRRDDYDALRKDFHRMFNAQVPAFDDYAIDTHGLEFYVTALTRIESLWSTPKVLNVLEESIFRKPDSRSEVFSLAAYRELLLLHSIAKKLMSRSGEAEEEGSEPALASALDVPAALPQTTGFGPTNILPLSARFQGPPAQLAAALPSAVAAALVTEIASTPDLTRPPVSSRLGLDIDLSQDVGGALEPLPPIVVMDAGVEAEDFGNLIEFDLDTPLAASTRNA
ncbi:type IV pilus assembly protein FimV [Polaromonas sp. LjRoot131]|uniref:type IV pilus assembly protein FimV n=1 Tax=Polaromonas sp. LjRoot131 TaxID=3342262 RepID=UPI003F4FED09